MNRSRPPADTLEMRSSRRGPPVSAIGTGRLNRAHRSDSRIPLTWVCVVLENFLRARDSGGGAAPPPPRLFKRSEDAYQNQYGD
jgi:hypothetical protein